RSHEKGDVVLMGSQCQQVGADFVRHITIGSYSIRTYDHLVDEPTPAEQAHMVIRHQLHIDPVFVKLPGGKPCALQVRPRLRCNHANPLTRFMCCADYPKGCAVASRGERARITMGQYYI